MTYTWSPAIKEPLQSDVWALRFSDFMLNWVVSGLTPTNGGSGILDIAAGVCYIDGWRVETDGETHDISTPDGLRWVYIELTKDGGGRVTSITETDYASEQTEDVRILIAKPTVSSGLITDVGDIRQYDTIDSSIIKLDTDVSLSDWRHASDVTKIDGGDIYAGTILNAMIGAAANIAASKILIDGTTQLSDWRHTSDLATLDGANVYDGSITDTQLATISWSKISKTGSNLNELATRSHTVLTDIGSNAHSAIDSHISDTSSPHGSTMSISTKLTTPKVDNAGNLVLESTGEHVHINAPTTGKNIYLNPSGKIYAQDDLVMQGTIQTESSANLNLYGDGGITIESGVEFMSLDGTGGYCRVRIDTRSSASAYDEGGLRPSSHEEGFLGFFDSGVIELAWRVAYVESMYDDDGNLTAYSEREDLADLRKIEELIHPETGEKVRNSWGDPIFDAGSIPEYIKRKQHIEAHVGTEREGRGYIKSGRFKGWVISLFKKLDEIDITQDEKLTPLFDELVTIKSRLDVIEQA